MALDRDLTVALVAAAATDRRDAVGVDLLAATGARGLRVLAETGRFRRMVLIEGQPQAAERLAAHARAVGVGAAHAVRGDARRTPLRSGAFDYVDVDPYGTPVPFLAEAFRLAAPSALLALTATDMPVLCGVARGVAETRYGGRPLRGRLGPEAGLRLLLARTARAARAQDRSIRVVAAYVHDHHVRALVRLGPSAAAADPIATLDPATFSGPRLPPGPPIGPLWVGPLFDPDVLPRVEAPVHAARPREAARWIALFRAESAVPAVFYYETNRLAQDLHLSAPPRPAAVLEELRRRGFPAAPSHVRPGAIRTGAPRAEVEAVAREVAGPAHVRSGGATR